MIDSFYLFGQGLMGGVWPGTVWPVVWTLMKIVALLAPLMGCVAYLTLWERKAIGFTQIRFGPNRVRPLLAAVGIMISLVKSFRASAIGCSSPKGPTRFGPKRI